MLMTHDLLPCGTLLMYIRPTVLIDSHQLQLFIQQYTLLLFKQTVIHHEYTIKQSTATTSTGYGFGTNGYLS